MREVGGQWRMWMQQHGRVGVHIKYKLRVFMYVCMYSCMYACMHAHMYTNMMYEYNVDVDAVARAGGCIHKS